MCGLFGVFRADGSECTSLLEMLLHLGVMAEDRGVDGSGLAFHLPGMDVGAVSGAARLTDVCVGRWRVVKRSTRFRTMWRPSLTDDLNAASMILGHTRFATQGACGVTANASPLVVGKLVGTHNGDVDARELRSTFGVRGVGTTDTAVLFAALNRANNDPDLIADVLTRMVGRAALAWSPLHTGPSLWLARAGMSPLAVVRDTDGNLYWASNPEWLRRMASLGGIELAKAPTMLAEGMLVRVEMLDGRPQATLWRQFKPTVREHDLRINAWKGFLPRDRAADRAASRHRVRKLRPVTV